MRIEVRTRLSICRKKGAFATATEAKAMAAEASIILRHYRCDRCGQFHVTSRTKGKRVPRAEIASQADGA